MSSRRQSIRFRANSIFREVGEFGRHQMLHLSLLAIPITIYAAISLSYVFTASDLIYRCQIPGCDDPRYEIFDQVWINDAFPVDENTSQIELCVRYKAKTELGFCTNDQLFDRTRKERCDQGAFVYKTSEVTIVNKLDVHCESSKTKLPLVGSVNNLGLAIFLPIAGILSDAYGRRKTFVWSIFLVGLAGVFKAFAPSYWLFLMLEFIEAAVGSAAFSAAFILGIEMVGKSGRAFAASSLTFFEAVGHILLGYLAFYLQNYQYLLLCLHIPSIFVLSYLWLVPESLQWLLSKRFNAAAVEQITVTARHNGQTLSDRTKESIEKVRSFARRLSRSVTQSPKEGSMFRSRRLLVRMFFCALCWTSIVFIDLSLTLFSVRLIDEDKYSNFIDVVLTEIPANIFSFIALTYFPRKWPISLSALAGGAICMANIWWIDYQKWFVVAAKFFTSVAYNNLYVFTLELFPTDGRNTVICLCSMAGRLGAIVAPHFIVLGLQEFLSSTLAGCGLVCAIVVWCLPETWSNKMPENVRDAENIGRTDRKESIAVSMLPDFEMEKRVTLSTIEEGAEDRV